MPLATSPVIQRTAMTKRKGGQMLGKTIAEALPYAWALSTLLSYYRKAIDG